MRPNLLRLAPLPIVFLSACGLGSTAPLRPVPQLTPDRSASALTAEESRTAPAAAVPGVQRREQGALRIEGIPELPAGLTDKLYQYQQVRGAALLGWLGDAALISTRFAETAQVHRVAAPGADRQQLTFFPEPVAGAAPAPDGRSFLFRKDSGGNENYQIYRFDLGTGASTLLTDGRSRNEAIRWNRAGDRFAFSSTKRNGRDTDVYVMAPGDAEATIVTEREGNWSTADWSADGKRLLVMKYVSANETELYLADIASRALTRLHPADTPVAFGAAALSRDGKGVYFTSDENAEYQQLRYEPLSGGTTKVLSAEIPWDVEEIALSDDGRWLAFTVNAGGLGELHLRDLRQGVDVAVPKIPVGLVFGLEFDRAGKRLGFVLNGPRSASDVFSFEPGKTALTRWTRSETGGLDASTFIEPSLVDFPSFDGRRIPAFYYRPAQASASKKAPVIINIHGGPEGQSQPAFSAMTEFYLRELGAAVIFPNVRGSTGYGKSYLKLDNGFQREDSVKDIGALLDWIARQPELDSGRVAVMGGSYGGYMTLASMTHYNDRLRAGIDIVGISNFVTFLTNTKDYRRDLRRVEYGDERDPAMRAHLEKISPTANAAKITKPMFIVQGANDPRVPASEAEQIVATIRAQGGSAWYLLAMDEGHGFQKKGNRDYYQAATVLFLQEQLLR